MNSVIDNIIADLEAVSAGWKHKQCGIIARLKDKQSLTRFLYTRYYLGITKENNWAPTKPVWATEDKTLVTHIRENLEDEYFVDDGWTIELEAHETTVVSKNGVSIAAQLDEIKNRDQQSCSLRLPCTRPYASPGFFTFCNRHGPADFRSPVTRFYISVKADASALLAGELQSCFSKATLPVTIKVANNRLGYDRPDTITVYAPRTASPSLQNRLKCLITRHSADVYDRTPAFTAKVCKGLAWADDPLSDGLSRLSFGMHRCSLIADALITAEETGAPYLVTISEQWRKTGLDLKAPHLSPNRET